MYHGRNLEEGKFLQKAHKKFRDLGENRTHDPPSSNSDSLTTELREALWRVGSKLNYCLASPCTGTLNNDDGYGSENVTQKKNSRCFKLHRSYSNSSTLS